VLAVGRGHRLAERASVSVEELADEVVQQPPATLPASLCDAILPPRTPSGKVIRRVHIGHDGTDGAWSLGAVLAALVRGQAVHPTMRGVPAFQHPDLVLVPIRDLPLVPLGLIWRTAAPSPLYDIYAAQWHFSSAMLTVVFAVYAIALLATLLVAGRLSDHVGRRSVILASLVTEVAAMVFFIRADSTVLLCLARVLQGVATGGAIGALSAALVELSPGLASVVNSAAPTVGLAAGALGTSLLVQYGPAPTRLIYWLLLAAFLAGAVLVAAMRETGQRRPGALRLLVPSAAVPRQARAAFVRVLPCMIALWALGGFYLSLGPALAATLVSSNSLLWGGLVIFLLTGSGAVATILCRGMAERPAMLGGCITCSPGSVSRWPGSPLTPSSRSSSEASSLESGSGSRSSARSAPSAAWPPRPSGPE
jgi:MFS family permease